MSGALAVRQGRRPVRSELHLADRCDHAGCAARAMVVTRHGGLPLMHCRAHFESAAAVLSATVAVDVRLIDLRTLTAPWSGSDHV